jgi:hypothetical protein
LCIPEIHKFRRPDKPFSNKIALAFFLYSAFAVCIYIEETFAIKEKGVKFPYISEI